MYKYKKIISPIFMIVITICLIIITMSVVFFHITNINTLKRTLIDVNYSYKVENKIKASLKNYMKDEDINILLQDDRVEKDVNKLMLAIKSNTLYEVEREIKNELEQSILNITDNSNDLNEYINKISNIYSNNLFPTTELNAINNTTLKLLTPVTYIFVICIICIILCTMYLLGAGKQKKWLLVGLYNAIIFCIIIMFVVLKFTGIYYLNNIITELINAMTMTIIYDILTIGLILLSVAMVLNYFEYFKKRV